MSDEEKSEKEETVEEAQEETEKKEPETMMEQEETSAEGKRLKKTPGQKWTQMKKRPMSRGWT